MGSVDWGLGGKEKGGEDKARGLAEFRPRSRAAPPAEETASRVHGARASLPQGAAGRPNPAGEDLWEFGFSGRFSPPRSPNRNRPPAPRRWNLHLLSAGARPIESPVDDVTSLGKLAVLSGLPWRSW